MSGVSPRSVQQPATAEDLFDQLGNVATLRAQLAPLGLLDPAITAAIDAVEARIADHLARTIKFDPGARVRLVRHGDALYAYDERDGQPSFEVVEPVDAAEIDLEQAPIPAPAE